MERSLSADYYPQRDQVSPPQRSSQTLDNCPSGLPRDRGFGALQVSHGKKAQGRALQRRRQGDGHAQRSQLLGRAAQWHGLEDDPIEDVSFEDLRLEPPRKVSGTGQTSHGREGIDVAAFGELYVRAFDDGRAFIDVPRPQKARVKGAKVNQKLPQNKPKE